MIARWPWGNADEWPDEDHLTPGHVVEPTVYCDDPPEPLPLLDADGNPPPPPEPFPVGFRSAAPSDPREKP